jgi:Ca-activated chloride channel family protein
MLWLLLALPLLVLAYHWILKRKRRTTVRLASINVAKMALGTGPSWRRHVPPLLLLLALAALLLSVARLAFYTVQRTFSSRQKCSR